MSVGEHYNMRIEDQPKLPLNLQTNMIANNTYTNAETPECTENLADAALVGSADAELVGVPEAWDAAGEWAWVDKPAEADA
jgi:hypothetical protein